MPNRRGLLVPLVAMALLVATAAAALVLDALWLQAARVELQACAEAAAFAAARELVSEDRLRPNCSAANLIQQATQAATAIAAQNRVAGAPVCLRPEAGDVRYGRLVPNPLDGRIVFLETDQFPTTVLVTAHRTRRRNNPIAMLLRPPGGPAGGDAVARAEVTAENRILGFQPGSNVRVPLLPMAILSRQASSTASGGPTDWVSMIEQRGGADRFTVDPDSGLVVPGSDGLPEMTLQCCLSESIEPTNACLIDVGSGLHTEELLRQVYSGVSQSDLSSWGGALPLHPHGAQFAAKRRFPRTLLSALRAIIGQPRLCLLYQQAPMSEAASPDSAPHSAASLRVYRVTCSRPVGLRILQVRRAADRVQIVVQPTVVITPTAWVPQPGEATDIPANPYVYKVFLTQ